jgi:DnaA family protein
MTHPQLPLPVSLRDDNDFASFLPTGNEEAWRAARAVATGSEPLLLLWGSPGSGRTHLLEAAVGLAAARGERAMLVSVPALPPDAWRGLEELDLLCLDDIDAIAGQPAAEEAFFHLFNAVRDRGGRLLMSAGGPPASLAIGLADLRSRLGAGLVVGLRAPDDALRLAVLQHRATCRGLELPEETARFLLSRASRRLDDLVGLLVKLDHASLASRRRLTVPFVRTVIER